jgi:hypothetical protein
MGNGYQLPVRVGHINFEGTDYDGAEVEVTLNVKIGVYRQIVDLNEEGDFNQVINLLCGFIREWNLEDEDGPIPVSPEGFDRINDVGFLRALLDGWEGAMQGVQVVAAPLDEKSNSGITSMDATRKKSPRAS